MTSSSGHPTYTKEQIEKYYNRIQLPEALRLYTVSEASPKASLSYLSVLQRYHLTNIPFENLSLHYSWSRHISIHPDALFQKIIESTGRGGYCMELNAIFASLLRSLGYKLYASGARVYDGNDYTGWDHMINIVTIGDNRYLVDVGFGSNYCAIQPLRLIHDTTGSENVAPASVRLVWKSIVGSENQLQKLWVYQHRIGAETEFKDMYCFTEIEFRHRDFQVMNWYTSTHPKAFFTQRVVCNKMVSGGDKGEKIIGVLTLQKDLKRRIGADTEHVEEFKTETDRVRALEEHFNIRLSTVEQEAIRGTMAEV